VRDEDPQGVSARAALYFTPRRDSGLGVFAASWLGRDAAAGKDVPRCIVPGIDAACQEAITASPRHYGFHATLKAPFELACGTSIDGVRHALANFVAGRKPVEGPHLALNEIEGFLALTLSAPSPEIDGLAAQCVEAFERFRAPLSDDDLVRRRKAGLTACQDAFLARWGYPYVFDEFRYHMTLTERLDDGKRRSVGAALAPVVAPFCEAPLVVDAVSLVAQPNRATPFTVIDRFPLCG
jgi:putative phosphonate metabolism protein